MVIFEIIIVMRPCIILTLLLLPLLSTAQDTLVTFQDISFSSKAEKEALRLHFQKDDSDLFAIFLASSDTNPIDSSDDVRGRFHRHLESLQREKLNGKSNIKKVKIVYEEIHKTYLKKYELETHFNDIFLNGNYNCVTGSALYSLAFEFLNIPYIIIERPTHVYLIAYPDKERITVETTTPASQFRSISEPFKASYLKMLRDQKMISVAEYNGTDKEVLFNKHYFGEHANITLEQLVGIQYMNQGIYAVENEAFLEALKHFEKAYLFYPSDRLNYLLMMSAKEAFLSLDASNEEHPKLLAKLSRDSRLGATKDEVVSEFNSVVQKLLFDKGQITSLDTYHRTLTSQIHNAEIRTELDFLFQYETARYYYNQGRYKECQPYIENAVATKPTNQDAIRFFIGVIANTLKNSGIDEAVATLEEYASKHPFLLENNIFNEMLLGSYLVQFEQAFRNDDQATGEKCRAIFENFQLSHKETIANEILISNAYSAAALYYFRKGSTTKARTLVAKGLEFAPNSYDLKRRQQMLK